MKFKLSRTSIGGAFPSVSGSCVLTNPSCLGRGFCAWALGIPAHSFLSPAVTLCKKACDLQLTGLFIPVPCKRAGAPPVTLIPPINTQNHIIIQVERDLWKQGWYQSWTGLLMSVSSPVMNTCGVGVSTSLNCCELELGSWEEWAVSVQKHSWILSPWLRLRSVCLIFVWTGGVKYLLKA